MTSKQRSFISAVKTEFGNISSITRAQVVQLSEKYPDISKYPPKWLKSNTISKGTYAIDVDVDAESEVVDVDVVEFFCGGHAAFLIALRNLLWKQFFEMQPISW